ncbi:hypothetical protein FRB95_010396 [Tulasnella sp. JGI-2019a]|nr:hypothetical protein FRB95_010396 [Tulasnella sp. JGI-2019a]
MSWMPFIATALTIAEVSQDDEDMCCTDRNALRELAESLREYRQQGLRLKAEVESVKVTEGEIIALQLKLQAIAQFLSPLKINIEHCIRAIRAGFALSGLTGRVVDATTGMEKARRVIKSLADSLEVPDCDWGVFVTLSDEGCAEFDEKIKALRNKEKKEIPVILPDPAPKVEAPQDVTPVTTAVPPSPVPTIVAPLDLQPVCGLPEQPAVSPSGNASMQYVGPVPPTDKTGLVSVLPAEFKTSLVSPISGSSFADSRSHGP